MIPARCAGGTVVGSDIPALAPAGATGRDDDPGAAVQNRSMLLGLEETTGLI